MDRTLVLRLLGKKDAVDLEDQIYNLRDISGLLREHTILDIPVSEENIVNIIRRLNAITKILVPIKEKLEDENIIQGYTNSKKYLAKFVKDILVNTEEVIKNLEVFEHKALIYHNNLLMDLLLVYWFRAELW